MTTTYSSGPYFSNPPIYLNTRKEKHPLNHQEINLCCTFFPSEWGVGHFSDISFLWKKSNCIDRTLSWGVITSQLPSVRLPNQTLDRYRHGGAMLSKIFWSSCFLHIAPIFTTKRTSNPPYFVYCVAQKGSFIIYIRDVAASSIHNVANSNTILLPSIVCLTHFQSATRTMVVHNRGVMLTDNLHRYAASISAFTTIRAEVAMTFATKQKNHVVLLLVHQTIYSGRGLYFVAKKNSSRYI